MAAVRGDAEIDGYLVEEGRIGKPDRGAAPRKPRIA